MSTNLRVLLDECVTDPLIELLSQSSSALQIKLVAEIMPGADDVDVMNYAKKEERILITTETGINEKKFKICTHPGIIVLAGRHRHESMQATAFHKFMLSGHRAKSNHAVVYVSEREARIKTLAPEDEIIKF